MKNMTLYEIAAACGGVLTGAERNSSRIGSVDAGTVYNLTAAVTGVAIDSRVIEPGFLFVPIRGERVDGHTFIPQVMENGALCTLSDHELADADYPYIQVADTVKALQDIAAHYRCATGITVVGVTGSVGKTSTKEMIASILSQKYNVLKTEGNFNNEIGLPLSIFRIRPTHEVAVLEMGISDFEEMHTLASIASPDLAVITNIGPCHLENLGDLHGVLKAKTEIFDRMKDGAPVFLNGDDPMLRTITTANGRTPGFFGLSGDADYFADDIRPLGLSETSCTLHLKTMDVPVQIRIPGRHMVANALAGAAVAETLGLTAEEIAAGVEALVPVSGRNHLIEANGITVIDDCYNANPISMKASLDVLSSAAGRRIAVLGDMGELGSDERALHREVGTYAVKKGIDRIVCIGELAKEIADAAKEERSAQTAKAAAGGSIPSDTEESAGILYFPTKEAFLRQIPELIRSGDTVLVKASHFMEFPEIVTALTKE